MDTSELKVIVVGGGTTGLLLAQGLKTAGIPYTVYERDSKESSITKSREWGMSLHWGGEFLATSLPPELRERIRSIECDPFHDANEKTAIAVCNGKTGEVLIHMPGTMPKRVSRRKMRALLSEGIDIQYGKRLVSISSETTGVVIASFDDGTTATGSTLVGCDGSKSKVRQIMVGSEASTLTDAGITILNFPGIYEEGVSRKLRMIHPVAKVAYHPDLNVLYLLCILDVEDPEKPATWKHQNFMSWQGPPYKDDLQDPSARMKRFKELGADFAEPWRSAALSLSDDIVVPVDRGQYWMPPDWDNHGGRITLAGDAAHPMLPHRAQGLNNALMDAAHLVEAFQAVASKDKSLPEAVNGYEEEMLPRARQEIQITLKTANMSHDYEALMQAPFFKIGLNRA